MHEQKHIKMWLREWGLYFSIYQSINVFYYALNFSWFANGYIYGWIQSFMIIDSRHFYKLKDSKTNGIKAVCLFFSFFNFGYLSILIFLCWSGIFIICILHCISLVRFVNGYCWLNLYPAIVFTFDAMLWNLVWINNLQISNSKPTTLG